ncbi:MAG TPA: hypothetical protein VGJ15_09885, partial [Pirellulales bacterium]
MIASTQFVHDLANCDDAQRVGCKAVNLGRLLRAGFQVPRGFVVDTAGFRAATNGTNGSADGDAAACIPPAMELEI